MSMSRTGNLRVFVRRTAVRFGLPWWRRFTAQPVHVSIVDAARRKSGVYTCAVHTCDGGFIIDADAFCWTEPFMAMPVCVEMVGSPVALSELMLDIRRLAPDCMALYTEGHEWV